MVRISKQSERRAKCPHRCRAPSAKSGPKKDNLHLGFKEHKNAVSSEALAATTFIPKIR